MSDQVKLSITVTAQQAQAIKDRVASGAYASVSVVIRAGLRRLEHEEEDYRERLNSLRRRVNASLDDPRPSLTGEQVRESIRRHHEATMKRHGKIQG